VDMLRCGKTWIFPALDAHFRLWLISGLVVLLGLCASMARAQSSTGGTVTGQVVDAQNAAIPGTEVKVFDTSTNTSFTTVTNDAGRYTLPQVTPGTYSIVFSKPGFSNRQVSAQEVLVGQVLTIDAKLEVGVNTSRRCEQ
jgi:hypothetical protein